MAIQRKSESSGARRDARAERGICENGGPWIQATGVVFLAIVIVFHLFLAFFKHFKRFLRSWTILNLFATLPTLKGCRKNTLMASNLISSPWILHAKLVAKVVEPQPSRRP